MKPVVFELFLKYNEPNLKKVSLHVYKQHINRSNAEMWLSH